MRNDILVGPRDVLELRDARGRECTKQPLHKYALVNR
jgi:hypothetical protein